MYLELIRLKKYRTRNRLSTNRWYCGGPLRLYKKCHRGNLNFDKNSRKFSNFTERYMFKKWLYLGCFWWNCRFCCWTWWTVERGRMIKKGHFYSKIRKNKWSKNALYEFHFRIFFEIWRKFILWFEKNKSLKDDRLIGLEIIFKSIYGFHQWYKSKVEVMIHGLTLINLVFTLKFS